MAKRRRLAPPDPTVVSAPGHRAPSPAPLGRAPIAAEAAQASQAAVAAEMADALTRARMGGRMILDLPLQAIEANHLVRDRTAFHTEELEALQSSIAARGQQTPIEVVDLGDGSYGLISGLRRLTVLQRLHNDNPEGGFDTVLAILRQPSDSAEAYLAMVEENEIRADLSYYERARIAAKAVEQGVFDTPKAALLALFRSASRAKRSKIRSFLVLVDALDGVLKHPEQIGERLGLRLSAALDQDARLGQRLCAQIKASRDRSATSERAILETALQVPHPETGKLVSKKQKNSPSEQELWPGLRMQRSGRRLVLEGEAITPAFEAALRDFLASRGPV